MDLTDIGYIRSVLRRHDFHFSKLKGQNFLIDPGIPARIASYIDSSMGVLEIGPGFGALTRALCARAGRVAAVELDRRLIPILRDNLREMGNLELIEGDILKLDPDRLAGEHFSGLEPVVAANLPYSITSPALTKLIEARSYGKIIVMVQAEVARRLCSPPGTKEYGAFTVYANVFCEPEILFEVSPESFVPKPAVNSAVILLERRACPLVGEEARPLFFKIVRASFSQRRKTLKNALSSLPGLSGATTEEALDRAGISPARRGETLNIDEFLLVTEEIEKRL